MALQAIVAILSTSTCLFLGIFYAYRKFYCHRYFKRIGINGPEPHWIYGNVHEFANNKRRVMLEKWRNQFGDFYGIYEGSKPVLVVSSIEGVEQVCIKQYWNFQGHDVMPLQPDPRTDSKNSIFAVDLLFSWQDDWKRLRTNINPCFSTGKLKSYMPLVNKSQSLLIKLLDKRAKTGVSFNIYECYQRLTLDVITAVAFGTELDSLKEENQASSAVLPIVMRTVALFSDKSKAIDFISYFPEIAAPLKRLIKFQAQVFGGGVMGAWAELVQLSRQVVDKRAKDRTTIKHDIIQALIENSVLATADGKQTSGAMEKLTIDEVVSSTNIFFGAGTETSSTTLAFVSYLLATHPEIQDKLYQEILKIVPAKEAADDVDYDSFMSLPYLDWVCKETLRLYPIGAFAVNRFVMDDTEVCGIPISKELGSVMINVGAIHSDPQLWGPVDPTKFYPERFSPEYSANRPEAAFLGFGYGPRICVGMRLALLEIKSTLVKVLVRYRIDPPADGYPGGLAVKETGIITPKNGVSVKLVPR